MTAQVPDANEAMRHYWNTVAGPRWVASPGFRERRNQESLALLLQSLRLAGGESVLEIGCGTGAVILPLAEAVGRRAASSRSTSPSRCSVPLGSGSKRAGCTTSPCCPGTRR